jgi:hypothetical protein
MRHFRISGIWSGDNVCRFIRQFAALAIFSAFSACMSTNSESHAFTNNDSMRFTSVAEQRETERKALAGDVEAAKRLGDYYIFIKHDLAAAKPWFSMAAARGDKDAKASLRSINEILAERNDPRIR